MKQTNERQKGSFLAYERFGIVMVAIPHQREHSSCFANDTFMYLNADLQICHAKSIQATRYAGRLYRLNRVRENRALHLQHVILPSMRARVCSVFMKYMSL